MQSGATGLGYLGQSTTGSDSRRTPRIAWLIADTDPLGTHNGIAWLTGANNLVEEPTREWWACHMGTERPLSPVIDRTIWVPAFGGGAGGGPRTRDTRSTGLSASVLPAADSWVDLGSSGYLGPPRTWTGGRRRNPGSQSPGARQAAPVVNKPENCQVHQQ